jgi:hypothetical protein
VDHVEYERIRGVSVNRPVESEDKIAFNKVTVEETVFYRPALDDQWSDSELRRLRLVGSAKADEPLLTPGKRRYRKSAWISSRTRPKRTLCDTEEWFLVSPHRDNPF